LRKRSFASIILRDGAMAGRAISTCKHGHAHAMMDPMGIAARRRAGMDLY
jgi:hypothetical protein